MSSEPDRGLVLVVEDDALQALALCRRIERFSGEIGVQHAQSCADAERIWSTLRPALVLADYRLGDGFGSDLIARMRDRGHRLPVVMMTGEDEQVALDIRATLDIRAVYRKPVADEDLRAALALIDGVGQVAEPSARRSRRVGRFMLVYMAGNLTASRVRRLAQAVREERWLALIVERGLRVSEAGTRDLCAWGSWLSAKGGRLCLVAADPARKRQLDQAVGAHLDVLPSQDLLDAESLRLTGEAERRRLLDAVSVSLHDSGHTRDAADVDPAETRKVGV